MYTSFIIRVVYLILCSLFLLLTYQKDKSIFLNGTSEKKVELEQGSNRAGSCLRERICSYDRDVPCWPYLVHLQEM